MQKQIFKKTLLIYSGGLDSTTLLYYLLHNGVEVSCVNFQYGSKHNAAELECAKKVTFGLKVDLAVIDLSNIFKNFKSSLLTGGEEIPHGHYQAENMKSTVVAYRNGIMLSIAAGIADSADICNVAYAAHSGDHFIYPDCRPEFYSAQSDAILRGTINGIKLIAPFVHLDKKDIVEIGSACNVPWGWTWTCYEGDSIKGHCGKCGSCVERKEAFALAKVIDTAHFRKDEV